MIATEWVAPDSRDDVMADVQQRARRLKAQRRAPVGLGAIAVAAVVALIATGSSADPTSLRTADQDDSSNLIDETKTVDAAGNQATVSAQIGSDPRRARLHAGATTSGGASAGADVQNGAPPTVRLTGHPLITDPTGDATGAGDFPVSYEEAPSADITDVDFQLVGGLLRTELHVVDLASPEGETNQFWFQGMVHGDIEIWLRTSRDDAGWITTDGVVRYRSGVGQTSSETQNFAATAVWEPATNRVAVEASLADINRALSSDSFATRRAQGDITVQAGIKMTELTGSAFAPTGYPISFPHDEARSKVGEYWLMGE